MANNCLVTKLKSVVDNPSLPKLNELKVPFRMQARLSSTIVGGNSPFDIFREDGTVVVQNQIENYSMQLDFNGYVIFKDIRLSTSLGIARMDLSGLKFINFANASSLYGMLAAYNGVGKLSDDIANAVKYVPNINELEVGGNDIYGSADCLVSNGVLTIPRLEYLHLDGNPRLTVSRSVYNTLCSLVGGGAEGRVRFDESQIID